MNLTRTDLRNIAIIAHVDHGKTTLVDAMLRQSGVFRQNQQVQERVMDSNDLERERGITIMAKNTAITYEDVKINIIDTPGHADFGGEVERILKMVDGVLLLVDAYEGPMPQTRFVLRCAMEMGHPVIVVVNKIDRPDARSEAVVDEVLELFIEMECSEAQMDSPFVFTSARQGTASTDTEETGDDLKELFDVILSHIPPPQGDPDAPLQVLVSNIDYDDYVGRVAIGRVERGTLQTGTEVMLVNYHEPEQTEKVKISNLYQFDGLKRVACDNAKIGDIVAISGIHDISIGDTLTDLETIEPLPFVHISQPTIAMTFSVNDSPFAGQEGKYVTSRQLRDRLYRELMTDVSLRVEDMDTTDTFKVMGRGELHLSILIETMRRQGYEFQVSNPQVLFLEEDGVQTEPMELVQIDVPEVYSGAVIEKLGMRRGMMTDMHPTSGSRLRITFSIPARGLLGYRSEFLTDTRGEGTLNSLYDGYQPYKGEVPTRRQGSLVAFESGESVIYGLYNAQERGHLFIGPNTRVYGGMVVGINPRGGDIEVNVCKKKHNTNIRAAGSDEALRLVPPKQLSLEEAIEWLADDELLEVTPQNVRLRKRILDATQRLRANRK